MLRALIALTIACLLQPAFANERTQTQQQLEATRQDISELKKLLSHFQQEQSSVQKDLRDTETEIGKLEEQVNTLQKELKKSEDALLRLNSERKKLHGAKLEQQRLIAIQSRAVYQSGRREYLKMLLNQQTPEKFARILTYYDYLNKARLEQLESFNRTLHRLANVKASINLQKAQLLTQKSSLNEQRAALNKICAKRKQTLAKLNSDVKDRDQRLHTREQDQTNLLKVLKTIEETLARQAREAEAMRQKVLTTQQEVKKKRQQEAKLVAINAPTSSASVSYDGPFSQARGKLPWPVDGRLLARFGESRGDDARTKWDGVMISSGAGTPVHALHDGRVVFADWLRGAGQLIILDHGNGYLSLYGHNQTLLKSPGDIVKAREAISTVGNSGGEATPALYFAIRQHGRPSDPTKWCHAQE